MNLEFLKNEKIVFRFFALFRKQEKLNYLSFKAQFSMVCVVKWQWRLCHVGGKGGGVSWKKNNRCVATASCVFLFCEPSTFRNEVNSRTQNQLVSNCELFKWTYWSCGVRHRWRACHSLEALANLER